MIIPPQSLPFKQIQKYRRKSQESEQRDRDNPYNKFIENLRIFQ